MPGTKNGKKIWVTTDIVDITEMAKRVKKDPTTMIGYWLKKEDFPKPVMRLGKSPGYYWPDVKSYFEKRKKI